MSRGYLLDTNVPSELTRPLPEPRVIDWLGAQNDLHLSVISIGELRKGISLLAFSKRRTQLEDWFVASLLPLVAGRILPITQAVGDRWGTMSAERQVKGAPLSMADGLVAATAMEYELTLVTRNVQDFHGLGLTILNPWQWQS